jgi:hypothetical protein
MTWIQIAHQIPGRTRLRSAALRRDERRCEQVADALSTMAGVREVAVRPYTGSVLVQHTRELTAQSIAAEAARMLEADVLGPGESPPITETVPPFSSVARKLALAMHELDRDIKRKSDGTVDLGTLATLGLFGAGAAEVVASGKLPIPPWFNLAWWGYRTFMTAEKEEIEAVSDA